VWTFKAFVQQFLEGVTAKPGTQRFHSKQTKALLYLQAAGAARRLTPFKVA
jgi:hypothetical protein